MFDAGRTDRGTGPSPFMRVVLLDREHRGEADQGGVVGEDADHVGAAADLAVQPLQRVGGPQFLPVVGREGIEGEDVLLGTLQRLAYLRQPAVERGDGLREPVAALGQALLVEDRPDQRRQGAVLVAPGMAEAVA